MVSVPSVKTQPTIFLRLDCIKSFLSTLCQYVPFSKSIFKALEVNLGNCNQEGPFESSGTIPCYYKGTMSSIITEANFSGGVLVPLLPPSSAGDLIEAWSISSKSRRQPVHIYQKLCKLMNLWRARITFCNFSASLPGPLKGASVSEFPHPGVKYYHTIFPVISFWGKRVL